MRSKYRYQRIDPPCSAVPAGSNHSASGGTCRQRLCPPTAALPAQVPVLAALALAWLQAPAQRGPPPENWPVESQAPWPWATRLRLGSPPLLALPFGLLPGVRLAQNKPPLRTLRSSRLPPLLFQTSHLPLPQAAFSFSPFHLITPLSLFLIFFSPVLCRALAQRLCSRLSLALDLPQTSPPIPGSRTGAHSPLVFPLARCLHCRSDPASLRPLRRPQATPAAFTSPPFCPAPPQTCHGHCLGVTSARALPSPHYLPPSLQSSAFIVCAHSASLLITNFNLSLRVRLAVAPFRRVASHRIASQCSASLALAQSHSQQRACPCFGSGAPSHGEARRPSTGRPLPPPASQAEVRLSQAIHRHGQCL